MGVYLEEALIQGASFIIFFRWLVYEEGFVLFVNDMPMTCHGQTVRWLVYGGGLLLFVKDLSMTCHGQTGGILLVCFRFGLYERLFLG